MKAKYILTDYVEQAMASAEYDKLEDGTFAGRIPPARASSPLAQPCGNVKKNYALCLKTGSSSASN